MGRRRFSRDDDDREDTRRSPARTPEARELEITSKAYDLAENQIREGTASSQVITHFLKAGSMRERLEQERIDHEIELMSVKRENLEAQTRVEELYVNAIEAMRSYVGADPIIEDPGHDA
jgi:hypothetical protein